MATSCAVRFLCPQLEPWDTEPEGSWDLGASLPIRASGAEGAASQGLGAGGGGGPRGARSPWP